MLTFEGEAGYHNLLVSPRLCFIRVGIEISRKRFSSLFFRLIILSRQRKKKVFDRSTSTSKKLKNRTTRRFYKVPSTSCAATALGTGDIKRQSLRRRQSRQSRCKQTQRRKTVADGTATESQCRRSRGEVANLRLEKARIRWSMRRLSGADGGAVAACASSEVSVS